MKISTLLQWGKQHRAVSILIALAVVFFVVSFIGGYFFNWVWTGFTPYTSPPHPMRSDYQRGKTLWDWLQLLIIPLVIGVGGYLFNLAASRTEQQNTIDNQREAALQVYIDKMSELLLKEHLGERTADGKLKPEYEQVRNVARVRTITVLTQLDGRRIGYVFAFLREAGLMSTTSNDNAVSLSQADLRGFNLSQANLSKANLSEADLRFANLSGADLRESNFNGADLRGANLNGADLSEANLSKAALWYANLSNAILHNTHLSNADLSGANLSDADLFDADLEGADLDEAILKDAMNITIERLEKQAKSLKGATMRDGSIH